MYVSTWLLTSVLIFSEFFFSSLHFFSPVLFGCLCSSDPDHIVLTMPALSPTMEKGNIASWKVKIGDKVKAGDVMAEVETDKATVAFESVETGYIAKILLNDGAQDVPVGTPVAVLAENEADVKAFESFAAGGEAAAAPAAAAPKKAEAAPAAQATAAAPAAAASSSAGGRVVASPAARRVASEQGVSLDGIVGTGPNSRILQADVKEQAGQVKATAAPARAAPSVAASSEGDFTDIPHSNVRKVIASRLSQSKQTIPHYYLSVDVTMDAVNKLRTELNAQLEAAAGKGADAPKPAKLSVNDFIIKASALACRRVPAANSSWQDNSIRQFNYVDVSVAVSTDAGLVTPIVRDADTKGLTGISNDVKALAAKARANKLAPSDYQGGTFTISNLGMFGVKSFSAIINPPQAAILAVGSSEARLTQAKDGSVSSAQVMSVTLSCDHRVVDGAVGAQWLQAFKGFLEKPSTMLL
jgi:pyruvate dehydrogenase E2 component (dihydrolipoamide acetyltransferase)